MKRSRLYPLAICALISSNAIAEDFQAISLPDSKFINSTSSYIFAGDDRGKEIMNSTAFCVSEQDSVIRGKSYHKVDNCTGDYQGGIREEKGKVFFVPNQSSKERLVYDFTLQAGDTTTVIDKGHNGAQNFSVSTMVVESVDSVEIYGATRKRINFTNSSWVEGVGNTNGFLAGNEKAKLNTVYELKCMSQNNVSFYPTAQAGTCPLPSSLKKDTRMLTEIVQPVNKNNQFVMEFDRQILNEEIMVINANGEKIQPNLTVEAEKLTVDLSAFDKGSYLMLMKGENNVSLGRMVKI